MVAKIIYRHSITHMLQPAFKLCDFAVLILFQRCSICTCSNFVPKTAFLISVQVVHFDYFMVVKNSARNYTLLSVNNT